MVSGTAGTGKTSLTSHLVSAACERGERCLYFSYEESADQIIRNMASIGIPMEEWVRKGLLHIEAIRPSYYGAEMHLLAHQKLVEEFQPSVVVIDPITNLIDIASPPEVRALMVRMIDFFKTKGITAIFTSLTHGGNPAESSDIGVSSLMDTWIMLSDMPSSGERKRTLTVLKSRGMEHSNQVRKYRFTDHGIKIGDVYIDRNGSVTERGA